jgi:hypothetical protein
MIVALPLKEKIKASIIHISRQAWNCAPAPLLAS